MACTAVYLLSENHVCNGQIQFKKKYYYLINKLQMKTDIDYCRKYFFIT